MAESRKGSKESPSGKETRKEAERVSDSSTPPTPVIYEVVRQLGQEEMERPVTSLFWSGLAGGLSISFSLLAQAILKMHLPETQWTPLLIAMGYPVGFLMVVLSRQQLFTETTITVMLPVMKEPTAKHILLGARMWGVVLLANLLGTLFASLFCTYAPVVSPELRDAMVELSNKAMQPGWMEMAFRAITSGFLMAAMVWLLPAAGSAQFHIVVVVTYIIGAGEFAHIVAGSMEAFMAAIHGDISIATLFGGFLAPVLAGNIVGGTVLFALISHAQVMKEI
jgi:formate/nitrite transporter FocA (FNT family)